MSVNFSSENCFQYPYKPYNQPSNNDPSIMGNVQNEFEKHIRKFPNGNKFEGEVTECGNPWKGKIIFPDGREFSCQFLYNKKKN